MGVAVVMDPEHADALYWRGGGTIAIAACRDLARA
jgi:hypothetical protein